MKKTWKCRNVFKSADFLLYKCCRFPLELPICIPCLSHSPFNHLGNSKVTCQGEVEAWSSEIYQISIQTSQIPCEWKCRCEFHPSRRVSRYTGSNHPGVKSSVSGHDRTTFFFLLEHRIIYLQFMHIHSVNANNALGERAYVSLLFPHLSSNEYIRWLHIAMNYLPQKSCAMKRSQFQHPKSL